jgi:hypothetical protein
MKIGRGNRSTRRKSAPVPLCPPQITHDQTRVRTRVAAVGSKRLTAALHIVHSFTLQLQWYRLPTGWTNEGSESESRQEKDFYLILVQTGSGTHWAFYTMGIGSEVAGAWSWLHLQLVPRSRKCESVHPLPHTPSWRSA